MVKLREKWLAALALAILLHAGIFLIFYINQNENIPTSTTDGKKNNAAQLAASNPDSDYILVDTGVYTTTLKDSKTSPVIQDDQEQNIENSEQSSPNNTEKEALPSQENSESKADTATINNQNLQGKNKEIERNSAKHTGTALPENVNGLGERMDDTAVLNRNMPKLKSEADMDNKADSKYESVNEELEEINNQLSDAINEVKKRNQQKIDQSQQPHIHEGFQ